MDKTIGISCPSWWYSNSYDTFEPNGVRIITSQGTTKHYGRTFITESLLVSLFLWTLHRRHGAFYSLASSQHLHSFSRRCSLVLPGPSLLTLDLEQQTSPFTTSLSLSVCVPLHLNVSLYPSPVSNEKHDLDDPRRLVFFILFTLFPGPFFLFLFFSMYLFVSCFHS